MTFEPGTPRLLRSSAWHVGLVLAVAALITTAHAPPAEAGRKGVAIGLGVAAAVIIASQLASKKSKGKSAYGSNSSGKKKHAAKERKGTSEKQSVAASRKSKDEPRYASGPTSTGKKSRYAADGAPSRGKGTSAGTAKSYSAQRSEPGDDSSSGAEGTPADETAREIAAAPPAVAEQGSSIPTDGKLAVAPPTVVTGATALARPARAAPAIITTPSEITAAQEHLRYLGYEVSTISGTVDPATRTAVMKYQQSLGAPVTGDLTLEQLQTLFRTAAQRQGRGT